VGPARARILRELPRDSAIKAIRAVEEGRVIKYVVEGGGPSFWVVRGEERDYLIFGDFFCTCTDFYISSLTSGARKMCYHLAAKKIAEAEGRFREEVVSIGEALSILEELSSP